MDLKIKLTVIFGCWLLPVLAQRETCPTPCQMGFTCAMVRHGSGPPSPGCISMEEAILLHRAVNGGPSGPGTGMNEGGQVTTMTQAQPFVPVAQRGRAGQIPGMQFLGGSQPLPPTFEQRFGSGLTAPTSQGQWGQPNSLAFPADGARQMPPAMTAGMNGMPGGMPGMMPGGMPGAMPGMMPGVMPGTMPGMMPGGMPGTMPGMMPGGMQGTMPGSMPPGGMPPGAMAGGAGMVPGLPIPPLQQGQTTGFVDPTTGQQAFPGGLNGPSGAVSAASAVHDTHANSNSWHDGSGGSNAGFGGVASHQQPIPGEPRLHGGAASAPAPSIGGHVSTIQEDMYGYYYLFNAGPDGSGGTRVNITKDGFCNKGHTHEQTMCVNMCFSDDQCPRNLKCCPSRCALDCIEPVIPTEQSLATEVNPPHSDPQAGVIGTSCEPCSSHLNCAGNTYCAMSSFCGNQMVCQPLQ